MTDPAAPRMLQDAIANHRAGRLAEAETQYRQVLAQQPQHPVAVHMLGLLASHTGRTDAAVELLSEASRLAPGNPSCHNDLGTALLAQGRTHDAIGSFLEALRQRPDYVEALNNLGNALKSTGRAAEAAGCYERALAIRPDFPEAHVNIGLMLAEQGRFDEAVGCYERALAIRPDYANALTNLGMALEGAGQIDRAMASLQRALALQPDYPEAHNNLGNVLRGRGLLAQAEESYRRALSLRDGYAEAHSNLGWTLAAQGRVDEAIASYDRALGLRPDLAEVWWNKALALLLKGDYAEGWPLYEWRWKAIARGALLPTFPEPLWLGETPIGSRTILLHHEQGLGDTLQMLRYVPVLARQGARVLLQMPPVLAALATGVPGASAVVLEGDRLPSFDVQCPMMSLPLASHTTLQTVPAEIPYLFAPPAARAAWRERLGPATRRRIGLVWSGSVSQVHDPRPVPLRQLLPLLDCDAEFHSLHKEYRPEDAALMRADGRIRDHSAELTDLGETAALIGAMDLVITIDTAVAHLAGGIGKPVWVMLPFAADFRWLLARTDSPWYPTMRLFRQARVGDWGPVVRAVVAAASHL